MENSLLDQANNPGGDDTSSQELTNERTDELENGALGGGAGGAGDDDQQQHDDDETDEVEFAGQKYRVPKPLKDAVMMHADYTRKTQAVADRDRGLDQREQTLTQQAETQKVLRGEYAKLDKIDTELADYANVDWARFEADQPAAAASHFRRMTQLQQQRTGITGEIDKKEKEVGEQRQRSISERRTKANDECKRDIPGWSPDLAGKMRDYAIAQGAPAEVLSNLHDAWGIKLLHAAFVGSELIAKQQAAARETTSVEPKPVTTVGKGGGRSVPPTGLDDRLSPEEWSRRRNAQLQKRNQR